jgi:hypothetical protein
MYALSRKIFRVKVILISQAPVAHSCNPSYSGGTDQEDCGLKPAWTNSSETLSRKYPSQKRWVEWLKVKDLSSSHSTARKKKK